MNSLLTAFAVIAALPLLLLLAGRLGALSGRRPRGLGATGGRLKPPSRTPNSVSSQAALHPDHPMRDYAAIDALPLKDADAAAAMARLGRVVGAMPGARIVERRDGYLYAEFETKTLRFVDDVEFLADTAAGVIHLRSSSRLGRKDFGVNRARAERIRRAWLDAHVQG